MTFKDCTPIFFEDFESIEQMAKEFEDPSVLTDLKDADILVAWYECGGYEGSSLVVYVKDGKLYSNEASHCSCYDLEGQWAPTETTIEALKKCYYADQSAIRDVLWARIEKWKQNQNDRSK